MGCTESQSQKTASTIEDVQAPASRRFRLRRGSLDSGSSKTSSTSKQSGMYPSETSSMGPSSQHHSQTALPECEKVSKGDEFLNSKNKLERYCATPEFLDMDISARKFDRERYWGTLDFLDLDTSPSEFDRERY